MRKPLSAALAFVTFTALAQDQPAQTPQSVTPSQTPAIVPPQTPGTAPVLGGPPPALGSSPVGGLSPCENMIGAERDRCLQAGSAAAGGTSQAAPVTTWPQTPPPPTPARTVR